MKEYLVGKYIKQVDEEFIFEVNNIGYRLKGNVNENIEKIYIYSFINQRTLERVLYGFETIEKLRLFKELLSIKGVGPTSVIKLVSQNEVNKIISAQKDGNILKLNSNGVKPNILSLIIPQENKDQNAVTILIQQTLEKYGFKKLDIIRAMKKSFNSKKSLDKNLKEIIIEINNL